MSTPTDNTGGTNYVVSGILHLLTVGVAVIVATTLTATNVIVPEQAAASAPLSAAGQAKLIADSAAHNVQVSQNGGAYAALGGATFANPTANATGVAINGVATTAMRSDAAPAFGTITNALVLGKNFTSLPTNGNQNTCGTATTADALADTLIATSATTQKGLVIQGTAAQTANCLEVQSSTGVRTFSVVCPTSVVTGIDNLFAGNTCGQSCTNGTENICIGTAGTGQSISSGSYNSFFGSECGTAVTTKSYNTAFGRGALSAANCAQSNAFGYGALYHNTGTNNIGFGNNAAAANIAAVRVTAVGDQALATQAGANDNGNTALGFNAGTLANGSASGENTFLGDRSGALQVTGIGNTYVGALTDGNATSSSNSIVLGTGAGAVQAASTSLVASVAAIDSATANDFYLASGDTGIYRPSAGVIGSCTGNGTKTSTGTTFQGGAGGGTNTQKMSGLINSQVNSLGNGADTTEDDLHTFTLTASSLNTNGQVLRYKAYGTFASTTNTETIRVYVGGTLVGTVVATASLSGQWEANLTVSRTGSSTQWASFRSTTDLTASTSTTVTTGQSLSLTDTNAIIIKTTAQEGTAGTANHITEKGFHVFFDNY